jgi:hypothetical protein
MHLFVCSVSQPVISYTRSLKQYIAGNRIYIRFSYIMVHRSWFGVPDPAKSPLTLWDRHEVVTLVTYMSHKVEGGVKY